MANGSWFSKRDKIMARFYSFRDGQYPYTALFVSFAPASKEQAATGGEAPTATSNESCKMGANAAAACKILVKIALKPPIKMRYRNQDNPEYSSFIDSYNYQVVLDIIRPWQPRADLTGANASKDKMTFQNEAERAPLASIHAMPSYTERPIPLRQPALASNDLTEKTYADLAVTAQLHETMNLSQKHEEENIHEDVRSDIDKEVDSIQNFNDTILTHNGFPIIPFSIIYLDLPMDLYAGSRAAQLDTHLILYICRACDMTGFIRSNFLLHHETAKHRDNIKILIYQHYILPSNVDSDQESVNSTISPAKDQSEIKKDYQENTRPSLYNLNLQQKFTKVIQGSIFFQRIHNCTGMP